RHPIHALSSSPTPMSYLIHHFGPVEITIEVRRYTNGRMAVQLLEAGEDYATVSVNIPTVELAKDQFIFKTYSENEGLYEEMTAAGLIETVGNTDMGWPICRLLKQ